MLHPRKFCRTSRTCGESCRRVCQSRSGHHSDFYLIQFRYWNTIRMQYYSRKNPLNNYLTKCISFQCLEINKASCDIANWCSEKWGTIVTGGIIQTSAWEKGLGKEAVQKELRDGVKVLIDNNIDLLLVEYFNNIEEMEWAIELALTYNKPVAATMCMGPHGDGRVSFLACSGWIIKNVL